jgi:hypothetical protein
MKAKGDHRVKGESNLIRWFSKVVGQVGWTREQA